ncbi:transglycosylase domain-containing protein [Oscillospiraceae bacterium MB08-C2-2]|nr:transglycosylase domain-containing protein [Oscillospiraceae bacterium MB08-C2-2]
MHEPLGHPKGRTPKPEVTPFGVIGGFFGAIGRILATFIMVCVITGCIVACIMTVYILKYIGSDDEISLEALELGYTSIMYYDNKETGQPEELQRLYYQENRIWVPYDGITKYTRDALISIEDQRFETHNGVDWKRTAGAFVNQFIPIYSTNQGGSTITQQLIKNVTGDNDVRIDRKVREIFRALNLSQRYSREQILEAYLNVVPFGNGTNGIESAANLYFDKSASELTLAESAAIIGITQFPGKYDPFIYPENNKERQEHILAEMLEQGKITQQEHDQAVAQTLDFKGKEHFENIQHIQSYFVDEVVNQVIADLVEKRGYTKSYATQQLYQGGYRIYTTVDMDIQKHLEEFYSTEENFPRLKNQDWGQDYPQSAAVITDPNGKVLALVGGIGDKEGARVLNRATQSLRHPGSSIKPLAGYGLSIEYNRVTWSTIIDDTPFKELNGKPWPSNYYNSYLGPMTIDEALRRSTNTVSVKLVDALTPKVVFSFLKNDLNFYSLVDQVTSGNRILSDIDLSPMALGGMTYGVTPLEMAGGYQMFINGGKFTAPYLYTRVEDSEGRIILETDTIPRQVLSEDTSVVMNRLLQRVTGAELGTGRAAQLNNMPTGGKTGTSTGDVDQWFIGFSPYYVCQVWLGYDKQSKENNNGTIGYYSYPPPVIFKSIMQPLHEGLEPVSFPDSPEVVSRTYCTVSGDLATPNCPTTASGWYRSSHIPGSCILHTQGSDFMDSSGDSAENKPNDNGTPTFQNWPDDLD